MAVIGYPWACPGCGERGDVRFGQSVRDGRLCWWESLRCARCGEAFERDGGEKMPSTMRQRLLAVEGTWALVVERVPRVAVALRSVLPLSVEQAVTLAGRMPCEVASGTQVEMVHLRERLKALRVPGQVVLVQAGAGEESG